MSTHHSPAGSSTGWKPEPGDVLAGAIEDISEHDAGYGRYPILELATDSGIVTVHAFHDVLQNELARLAPTIGDTVTIAYQGRHPGKGYHMYRVRDGAGRGRGIDWSAYGDTRPESFSSDVPSDFEKPREATQDDDPVPF